jgi:hypothetical protein
MPIPRDAHYEPGTNRHSVRLASGQVVSRATAENIYAQSRGFRSNYDRKQGYRRAKQSRNFSETKAQAARHGTSERDYTEATALLQNEYARVGNKYDRMDKSPTGAIAKYQIAIGRRDENAVHNVGDSPKV